LSRHNNRDADVAYVMVDGVRYAYRRAGQGPALLLLHGVGETSKVFWRDMFVRLSNRYTLVAVDLLGFGDTDKPARGYEPATEARAMLGILEQLGLEKPVLLGHSLGGIIAARYATLFPDRLAGLIIYSTPIPGSIIQNLALASKMPAGGVALMSLVSVPIAGWLLHQNRSPDMIRLLVDAMRVTIKPSDYTDEMIAEGMRNSYDAVTQWVRRGFLLEDIVHDLHRICVPTLLVQGEYDLMPADWTNHVAHAFSNARLVTIKGAAHTALAEQPDHFILAVSHFLEEIHYG
jgi:pimeloyl-ACP methyl ester carboxylesterase